MLTDNEIIKAYGCCNLSHDECGGCDNCPCKIEGECIVPSGFELEREVFNLLNRQKAEIKRLEQENFDRSLTVETWKCEAVKEFAKRLKEIITMSPKNSILIDKWYIDNLVKEMVGEG